MARIKYTAEEELKIISDKMDEINIKKTVDGVRLLPHERFEALIEKYQVLLKQLK